MKRIFRLSVLAAVISTTAGCGALINTGSAELAGIGGAALADAVTNNGAVAAGIGLGVQAAARAGVEYAQRRVHRAVQDEIARTAGALEVGAVGHWQSEDRLLEKYQRGRVTVSRIISTQELQCKEAVFSVDRVVNETPSSAFYVTIVCQDGLRWKWASAEPSTDRWGGLQ